MGGGPIMKIQKTKLFQVSSLLSLPLILEDQKKVLLSTLVWYLPSCFHVPRGDVCRPYPSGTG